MVMIMADVVILVELVRVVVVMIVMITSEIKTSVATL